MNCQEHVLVATAVTVYSTQLLKRFNIILRFLGINYNSPFVNLSAS